MDGHHNDPPQRIKQRHILCVALSESAATPGRYNKKLSRIENNLHGERGSTL
jgi:hypothetical protein